MDAEFSVTFRQVLRNKQFFALWLAQWVSNFGDWLAMVALFSLAAFRWQGTPYQVSGVLIVFALPWAFLGPVAGVFVDRWNPKRTMIASDLIRAVLAALLAFATNFYELYSLLFALSAVSCFFLPAQTAVIPQLVRKEELLVANALNAQTIQFNKIVSPALAGVLVGWAGERICFYLDSLSFLCSAALLSVLALGARSGERVQGMQSVLEELQAGLKFLWNQGAIRFVTLALVGAMFAVGAFDALVAVYVRDVLQAGSPVFGALVAVIGAGTIAGAVVIGRLGQQWSRVGMVVAGILGVGVGVLLLARAERVTAALLCSLGLGVAVSWVLIASQTVLQEETPAGLLGRVSSTAGALMTIAQLASAAVSGKAAEWLGIRNVYHLVGGILVATGLAGYALRRRTP